jgi:hypothetical protein
MNDDPPRHLIVGRYMRDQMPGTPWLPMQGLRAGPLRDFQHPEFPVAANQPMSYTARTEP